MSAAPAEAAPRGRLSHDERRRQLLGIGLRMLVERPIHELSVDAVAAEAGISRGLLFHYFATKSQFHDAVVEAAARRVLRRTAPDEGVTGEAAVRQFAERFCERVDERRASYLALVFGSGPMSLGGDRVESLRATFARRALDALGLDHRLLPVAQGWCAYLEERALQWSAQPPADRATTAVEESDHAVRALRALLEVTDPVVVHEESSRGQRGSRRPRRAAGPPDPDRAAPRRPVGGSTSREPVMREASHE